MGEMEIYKEGVLSRFKALPESEKEMLMEVVNTPAGPILGKVLGPEIQSLFPVVMGEAEMQQPAPEPMMQEPQRRPGLGARR